MESNLTRDTQDTQVTVDVPQDRVAQLHAFFARFLGGPGASRKGHRHGGRGRGHHGRRCIHRGKDLEQLSRLRSQHPRRLRSDGRQAGRSGRTRGACPGILRVVRRISGAEPGTPPPFAERGSSWPARPGFSPAWPCPSLVGRRCRPGGMALPQACAARARVIRPPAGTGRGSGVERH
jgi:hypothetical protein